MATTLKLRRGTTAAHSTFTGAAGEVTVDTDKDVIVVHDGSTAGGFPLLGATKPQVLSVSSSSDALRITQTGTGNALVVEDSTNPDSTPFVVNADGNLVLGSTTVANTTITGTPNFSQGGVTATSARNAFSRWDASSSGFAMQFGKSRGGALGTFGVVSQDDSVGQIQFFGSDPSAFVQLATIGAYVDGTPGAGDMPGRLVFSTTADGASTPTERMRIDSAGQVGIGTSAPLAKLNVNGTDGELIRISVTSDAGVVQEPALGFATGVTNTHPAAKISALEFDASDSRASLLFYTRDSNSDVAPTERLRIDSSGNVGIGTSSPACALDVVGGIQTSRTAVTSPAATDGNVFSGTYTPSITNTTNVAASTPYRFQYMRVGNTVTVSGRINIDPTASATASEIGISLPIASAFPATADGTSSCAGVGSVATTSAETSSGGIFADTTNDRATFRFLSGGTAARDYYVTFTYLVI